MIGVRWTMEVLVNGEPIYILNPPILWGEHQVQWPTEGIYQALGRHPSPADDIRIRIWTAKVEPGVSEPGAPDRV